MFLHILNKHRDILPKIRIKLHSKLQKYHQFVMTKGQQKTKNVFSKTNLTKKSTDCIYNNIIIVIILSDFLPRSQTLGEYFHQ